MQSLKFADTQPYHEDEDITNQLCERLSGYEFENGAVLKQMPQVPPQFRGKKSGLHLTTLRILFGIMHSLPILNQELEICLDGCKHWPRLTLITLL